MRLMLDPQEQPWTSGQPIIWQAADTVNGHFLPNNGMVEIIAYDPGSSSSTVTIIAYPDALGRSENISATVGSGITAMVQFGPFPMSGFNVPNPLTWLHIDVACSGTSSLLIAALRRY